MTNNETIHSGHFMVSNPYQPDNEDDEEIEVDVVDVDDTIEAPLNEKQSIRERNKVYSLQQDEKPVTYYKFGAKKTQTIAIDVSLNKLNKCIKIAYMKLTTPKWKDFKGLKLQWKHRIRLNNVIWRAYYMEFRKPNKRKKTPTCYFAVPDDDTTHSKIEGTVIEGMYWKRKMGAICAQYKKWRTYNKSAKVKKCCKKASSENNCECRNSDDKIMRPQKSQTPQNLSTFDDYFSYEDLEIDNEFTNSLFDSLNMPFLFPNTKDMMQGNNSDFIQPGLLSLQPSLEEIMNAADEDSNLDSLEPTFSIQQPQSSNELTNGRTVNYNFNNSTSSSISTINSTSNSINKNYVSKGYENTSNGLLDYNQPTRQSSSLPINGLMTGNLSQPLYSQAVYETRATPSTSSLNDSPVGSVIGLDLKSAPRSNSNINAVNSLASTLDYMPQLLVSASLGQTTQTNLHTFTSMIGQQNQNQGIRGFVVDQNNPLISPQQWWNQYSSPEEKALQMLRSPVSQNVPQTTNGFPTSMLLGLSQANQSLQQQSATYSNPYAFSASNFKTVQQPALQQISINQQPNLSQEQLQHLQLASQQRHQQNPFQTQTMNQLTTNVAQNFNQRQPPNLAHYLPQNGDGVSTPSASLASILTAGPRPNQQISPIQQRQEIKTETLIGAKPLNAKASNRQNWNNNSNAGTSISEALNEQSNILENDKSTAYSKNSSMKAPKQPVSAASNAIDFSAKNSAPTTNGGYKRRNGRQSVAELSPPEPNATNSRRSSTRNKRTRSQMLPDIPAASTSVASAIKQHPLSQPASVQTQFSYSNDGEILSPMDTPQTENGIASDESFEERSPSVFSTSKRARYSTPCAEAADSTLHPEERKRLLHLNAEKNRREALKDGFEALVQAIPVIEETGIKVTNAVVLNRAAQHIRNLCQRIDDYDKQVLDCEKRHELLQKRVSIVQSSLPSNVHQSSSGQSSSTMSGQIMQFFERYVREKSTKDSRFFMLASMLKPIVESFSEQVHPDSTDKQQVRNSILNWSDSNFKVGRLRPLASQALIKIATEGNLMNPNSSGASSSLQDYLNREVEKLSEYNDSI